MTRSHFAIPLIVLAQLLGTSLWFSGNAVVPELKALWGLSYTSAAWLLMAVQLGFIAGTFLLALSGWADRFPPHRIFGAACFLGALANTGFAFWADDIHFALFFRTLTGLALAGIYPLGMKLILRWAPNQAGVALSWLVGALTLGTATPFFIRAVSVTTHWRYLAGSASLAAVAAAAMILWLGSGKSSFPSKPMRWAGVFRTFRIPAFRRSALGYFGHMWELYAFWSLVPLFVNGLQLPNPWLWSAGIIAVGSLGCIIGGRFSRNVGSAQVAKYSLAISGGMCLLFPLVPSLGGLILILWGFAIVADSPHFSKLSAKAVPSESVGAALAIQNSIGFLITIGSIQLTNALWDSLGPHIAWLLLPGPILGLFFFRKVQDQE